MDRRQARSVEGATLLEANYSCPAAHVDALKVDSDPSDPLLKIELCYQVIVINHDFNDVFIYHPHEQ